MLEAGILGRGSARLKRAPDAVSPRNDRLSFLSDHTLCYGGFERRPAMGLFVTFSAEELQEFKKWREASTRDGEVMIIEPVSRRRPDSFKVWFEKPIADHKNLSWYKPVAEKSDKTDGE
jgi:hypothetical protein